MSDLSPLSEVKQKLDFGDVRAVDDPLLTWEPRITRWLKSVPYGLIQRSGQNAG
jgi:hypothetical protein